MADDTIQTRALDNGLVLVAESMEWLESAAFTLMVPAGAVHDPSGRHGLSSLTCEMVERGCGSRSSREYIDALEERGVDHNSYTGVEQSSFSAAMLAEHLEPTLGIFADVVRRPHLPADQLEDARNCCLQEIRGVEDELGQKALIELRRLRYADPWGRPAHGKAEDVSAVTIADVQEHFARCYQPRGAILAVAGRFDWPRLVECVEQLFGDWQPGRPPSFVQRHGEPRYLHLPCDSNQIHLGIAYPSVAYRHPDYFFARGAVGVLSDGMSSRLFTEVRENRGLCYAIYASHHSLRDTGGVFCYAGTSTDRAQETLNVTLAELRQLSAGVLDDELARLKARTKSALILQQESSLSRSGSLAAEWSLLGRARSLDEIGRIIDGLTSEDISRYLAENPPCDFVIVTLGDKPLEVDLGVSSSEAE